MKNDITHLKTLLRKKFMSGYSSVQEELLNLVLHNNEHPEIIESATPSPRLYGPLTPLIKELTSEMASHPDGYERIPVSRIVNLTNKVFYLTDGKTINEFVPSNIRDNIKVSSSGRSFAFLEVNLAGTPMRIEGYTKVNCGVVGLPPRMKDTIYVVPDHIAELCPPERDDIWVLGQPGLRTGDIRSLARIQHKDSLPKTEEE